MRSKIVHALLVSSLWIVGCSSDEGGGDGGGDTTTPGVFRVVLMADTHVIGPQYECCSESPGVDNASIIKTEDRLREVVGEINAITPRPEMVFVLGDIVHAAHHSTDPAWYQANRNAFTIASELFELLDMPVHVLWGNHDYEVNCSGETYDRALSHQVQRDFFGTEPYYSLDHKGWKFLFLNSQLGPTWDVNDARCDTSTASFGADQLDWTARELEEGMPTLVFSHHNRLLWLAAENPGSPNIDLRTVLGRYDNVEGNFAGHLHRWIDQVFGDEERVLSGTRYDTDNFWLLELDGTDRTYSILDEDKAIWLSSCARTYSYDGTPTLVEDAPEEGDCAEGL